RTSLVFKRYRGPPRLRGVRADTDFGVAHRPIPAFYFTAKAGSICLSTPTGGRRIENGLPCGSLGRFRPVLRPSLFTVLDTAGVQGAAYDVVPHARQVLDATAPHQHHRVLLQVVAF